MEESIKSRLETLTLKDNFMFGAVMCEPENCRPFLEMALGFPIERLTVSIEKSLVYHPEYKGVRLDVEARDVQHTRYNVEMQVIQKPYLERRARYYRSQIDMDLLQRGHSYGNLPDTYVIFICDFDPFGLGKYRYTFQNVCREKSDFVLQDGQTTMFLSTCGEDRDEIPENLVNFLQYIGSDLEKSTEEFEDAYVRQLQAAVRGVKASREMEARYMVLQEMLQDERAAGKAEGRAEGKAEAVLDLLEELSGEVPDGLRNEILSEKDGGLLKRYLKLAAAATSVEEFVRQISCATGKTMSR